MTRREVWKTIDCGGASYTVSNLGHVRTRRGVSIGMRRGGPDGKSYLATSVEKKRQYVHRLVALAFVPNPKNLPEVNHLNAVKTDNRAINLEWVGRVGNQRHALAAGRITSAKPVYCETNGKTYRSRCEAARDLGLHDFAISRCISGKTKHVSGFKFRAASAHFPTFSEDV